MVSDLKSRLFEEFNYEKSIVPIIVVQSVLSSLQLLDSLNITIYPMIHRATVKKVYSLGFSLTPALLLLSLITFSYIITRKWRKEIMILTSASIALYIVIGFDKSAAILSLLLVVDILLKTRRFQEYLTWLLALLAIFEGLALLHWILLPLGITSPLAWFADLEMSLFYFASYLAPLLVLLLMFMWMLKPVLRWVFVKEKEDFEDIV